jgi:CBS domain-containing protein
MTSPPITIPEDANLETTARLMLDKGIGCLPVVDETGMLVGIVTESDFAAKPARIPFSTFEAPQVLGQWMGKEGVERIYREARRREAREVMSHPVHVVGEDDPIEKALELMLTRKIKHVCVVRDGRPAGVVARHDLLKLMRGQGATGSPG